MVATFVLALAVTSLSEGLHIRTTDHEVSGLVQTATEQSPTFHALAQRLAESDVVAYVEFSRLPPRIAGRLTFVGAAAGVRYVRIELDRRLTLVDQMAILGHELCHAVEVAGAPAVVDAKALGQLYKAIGFAVGREGQRVESLAAMATTHHVRRELSERARSAD